MTPPRGLAGADVGVGMSEPGVPEWTLSTDDGKVHRFRELNTLQKWIVERKVSRTERISRGGGPWLALEDVVELTPFFKVVDEADRARATTGIPGGMPTAPTFAAPAGGWSAGSATSPASGPFRGGNDPLRSAGTPPPVPADARRPVSEDGPTVPNRHLTGDLAAAAAPDEDDDDDSLFPASPPPPTLAARPLPGMRDSQPMMRASNGGPPVPMATPPAPRPAASAPRPAVAAAAALVANEGIRRAGAAAPRSPMGTQPGTQPGTHPMSGQKITAQTRPLDEDSYSPSNGHRNAAAATLVVLLMAAAGGGYWWWQGRHQENASGRADVTRANSPAGANALAEKSAEPAPAPGASGTVVPNTARITGALGGGNARAVAAAPATAAPAARTLPVRAPAAASSSYDHLVAEADRLLEKGKTARAEKLYAQALAARPDGVAALTGTAYVLLDRQRHFKAIETFRRALAIQPTFGPALYGIAESYRARGDTAQALGAYRQYLTIAPSGSDAPAARRQIKDLESAAAPTSNADAPARRASPENSPPAEEDTN
ncbi:MAG: tetratricopeptide repeat protein [Myxococcales bacterium]